MRAWPLCGLSPVGPAAFAPSRRGRTQSARRRFPAAGLRISWRGRAGTPPEARVALIRITAFPVRPCGVEAADRRHPNRRGARLKPAWILPLGLAATTALRAAPGSGLIGFSRQKIKVAARAFGHLALRMATRRQSSSRPDMLSIRLVCSAVCRLGRTCRATDGRECKPVSPCLPTLPGTGRGHSPGRRFDPEEWPMLMAGPRFIGSRSTTARIRDPAPASCRRGRPPPAYSGAWSAIQSRRNAISASWAAMISSARCRRSASCPCSRTMRAMSMAPW